MEPRWRWVAYWLTIALAGILFVVCVSRALGQSSGTGTGRVGSTAYCLNGTLADGTHTRSRSVAHNGYPLGTHLTIRPSPTGHVHFVVRDRIGHGTQLDFWVPSCDQARRWGRRTVRVTRGWR